MRIRLVLTLFVVLLACSVSMSWAQQGRGGGRQGGFQRGGPGMTNRLALLRSEEVQTELGLDADKLASVEKLQEELRGQRGQRGQGAQGGQRGQGAQGGQRGQRAQRAQRAQGAQGGQRGQGGGRPEMTDEQRDALRKRAAERSALEQEKLAGILSAEQTARLEQIYIQQLGVRALSQPDVAKELGISDTLMAKIEETSREAMGELRTQTQGLFQSGDRAQAMAKMRELREKADEKTLDLLTPEQKEAFAKMKGAKFDMPRRGGGFGGGQRGQGGQGRPNRANRPS